VLNHEVLDKVHKLMPYLRSQADEAERLGRLPEETAQRLKETGVVRLMQPKEYGGYEADPRVFFEAVTKIASCCGASGWLSGIIGVHPWELGVCEQELQEEIWGDDPDTWVCSTYMPTGRALPVDGGYILNGHWAFSSGCDLAEWIILGGLIADADGKPEDPPRFFHFILPRSDFEIIEGTWDVVGLSGTGSKDIDVRGAFVPHHRAVDAGAFHQGIAPNLTPDRAAVFRVPWAAIFPNAITSAVIGICEGALEEALAYQKTRVKVFSGPAIESPITMTVIGEAAGEIDSCRAQLMRNVGDMYESVERHEEIPLEVRARGRRDQVQGSWRAVRAVDQLFDFAGGGALRRTEPLQRLWRDAHAGLHHMINGRDVSFHSYTSVAMGFDPLELMI
jgi:3-hydroxy-9,10-secoandrosta-1,3,5(10)-triene-9,17-dione monooxygenase